MRHLPRLSGGFADWGSQAASACERSYETFLNTTKCASEAACWEDGVPCSCCLANPILDGFIAHQSATLGNRSAQNDLGLWCVARILCQHLGITQVSTKRTAETLEALQL
ncbi:unnamed protein product [Symbiodinium necroappetens]|uniref:Uncharacterized protein n=1 Tax=Symbiodinium necroappetens TaxID=1628268 RepID=A0A812P4A3_9DINO|nr:unnamed protein product [Symbiodinium necroappetens]